MARVVKQVLGIQYAGSVSSRQRWGKSSTTMRVHDGGTEFGPSAPQVPANNPLLQSNSSDLKQDEDCLSLNIFSPQDATKLPVMVWIHGGGFQTGSAALPEYLGTNLAQVGNVIVVTINYRLGCLGFLRLCDISKGNIAASGNEGLGDQITALKWLHEHIHEFGGDNTNITLFGESAGAMSIACLLASPKANKLFHKAILQSGAGHTYSSIEKANALAFEFLQSAEQLGYSLEQLIDLSVEKLMHIQAHFLARPDVYLTFGILPFTPVIETELLPLPPCQAIASGCAKDIVIIAGSNTNEWTYFAAMLRQDIEQEVTLRAYLAHIMNTELIDKIIHWAQSQINDPARVASPQKLLNEIYTEFWFAQPCHRILAAQFAGGGISYRYKLGRRSPIEKFGCTHAADIGFVFDTTNKRFHGNSPRVNALIDEIQSCWTHFAHTGLPILKRCNWPCYDEEYKYTFFDHNKTHLIEHDGVSQLLWSEFSDKQLTNF
ncbi:MAG: para-nitrobenzyl esterase [Granulosicoccus sp.]|jgi:para-nitrobenzyl esterase